jgi:hypothetical protein
MSRYPYNPIRNRGHKVSFCLTRTALLFIAFHAPSLLSQTPNAQAPPLPSPPSAQRIDDIERRLNEVTATLTQTQQALEQSLQEIQKLRAELDALQPKPVATPEPAPTTTAAASAPNSTSDDLKSLHDQMDTLQAEIKQHDQIKVETTSKYPVRITGLILFNAFANDGVVDDAELPSIALPRNPGGSHGSFGGTMRQSVLGIEATGPRLWQSHTAAAISADFFGGMSTNANGYSTAAGLFRLRQADVSLDWTKTTVEAGVTEPLFTPLAPTSYATVAQPALSASGNLWSWSPQLRVEQRIPISDTQRIGLEGGFIDPGSSNYATTQLVNPEEASHHPGYEGRVSWRRDGGSTASPTPFVLGVGAYSANQFYSSSNIIHSWAVAADWEVPLYKRLGLTGEFYRGRSLGDFGGGAYKNLLSGTDTITGLPRSTGVEVVGGWSQLKFQWSPTLEANASWGLDDALASNFDNLILSTSTVPLEQYARNTSIIGNIIYRPKTYLIFSPEYRRLQSWRYTGNSSITDIFTLTVGYQF